MRPHGRYSVDSRTPRALGRCDRCGFIFNHDELAWQFQWVGTKLQNQRILVCQKCMDVPQEQLRTIILPADPEPILNARPEDYVGADNPQSQAGVSAIFSQPTLGNRIGNLTGGGGINAPFDGNPSKPSWLAARNAVSNSSYDNYVGINWDGNYGATNIPPSLLPNAVTHSLLSFTARAPRDRGFLGSLATSYVIQSSPVGSNQWGAWTTISSGTTTGAVGETIGADCTGDRAQFHRIAFLGDGLNYVAVAQVEFNVAQTGEISA